MKSDVPATGVHGMGTEGIGRNFFPTGINLNQSDHSVQKRKRESGKVQQSKEPDPKEQKSPVLVRNEHNQPVRPVRSNTPNLRRNEQPRPSLSAPPRGPILSLLGQTPSHFATPVPMPFPMPMPPLPVPTVMRSNSLPIMGGMRPAPLSWLPPVGPFNGLPPLFLPPQQLMTPQPPPPPPPDMDYLQVPKQDWPVPSKVEQKRSQSVPPETPQKGTGSKKSGSVPDPQFHLSLVANTLAAKQSFNADDISSLASQLADLQPVSDQYRGRNIEKKREELLRIILTKCVTYAHSKPDENLSDQEFAREVDGRAFAKDLIVTLMYHPVQEVKGAMQFVFPDLYRQALRDVQRACSTLMQIVDPEVALPVIEGHLNDIEEAGSHIADTRTNFPDQLKENAENQVRKLFEPDDPIFRQALLNMLTGLSSSEDDAVLARARELARTGLHLPGKLEPDQAILELLGTRIDELLSLMAGHLDVLRQSYTLNNREDPPPDLTIPPICAYALKEPGKQQSPVSTRATAILGQSDTGKLLGDKTPFDIVSDTDRRTLFSSRGDNFQSTAVSFDASEYVKIANTENMPEETQTAQLYALEEEIEQALSLHDDLCSNTDEKSINSKVTLINIDLKDLGNVNVVLQGRTANIVYEASQITDDQASMDRAASYFNDLASYMLSKRKGNDTSIVSHVHVIDVAVSGGNVGINGRNIFFGMQLNDYLNNNPIGPEELVEDTVDKCLTGLRKDEDSDSYTGLYKETGIKLLSQLAPREISVIPV